MRDNILELINDAVEGMVLRERQYKDGIAELRNLRSENERLRLELDGIKRERICDDCMEKYDKQISELESEIERLKGELK